MNANVIATANHIARQCPTLTAAIDAAAALAAEVEDRATAAVYTSARVVLIDRLADAQQGYARDYATTTAHNTAV